MCDDDDDCLSVLYCVELFECGDSGVIGVDDDCCWLRCGMKI